MVGGQADMGVPLCWLGVKTRLGGGHGAGKSLNGAWFISAGQGPSALLPPQAYRRPALTNEPAQCCHERCGICWHQGHGLRLPWVVKLVPH